MWKNGLAAWRSLFKKKRHNVIKIISLSAGLSLGLVLIAKVYFEQSYDVFFPDFDRIYSIQSVMPKDNELHEWPEVSGAIAPGMKAEMPEIEVATRFTEMGDDMIISTPDRKKYTANVILGDTNLFDIFPLPVVAGNVKDVLARPMYVMVSEKIARKMGGDVIGQTFWIDSHPHETLIVGGIFKDLPENSHLAYNVIISLPSIGRFFYDGTDNWVGNDRYAGYVKLRPGVCPESLKAGIRRMQEKNQPLEEMKKAGVDLSYTLRQLGELHNKSEGVKRVVLLLSLLAFALMFTAVMNYVLIVISDMVNRSKEIAVHKCYGASEKNIHGIVFSEAILHLCLALALAAGLILVFRGTIQDIVQASVGALFLSKGSLLLLGICLAVLLLTGLIPGFLYARIPVAAAFRSVRENRRLWKLGMLFLQFIAAGFLVTLLVIIHRQYARMVNDNPGYAYENLAYSNLSGIDSTSRQKAIDEMLRLPEVESVSSCSRLFFNWPPGNNVYLPGDGREYFNIADMYSVGPGYFEMMEIPIVAGRSFQEDRVVSKEVMVSRRFVDKMSLLAGWNQEAVGQSILVTEHSESPTDSYTICGVYEDVRLGVISEEDMRPSVMFYNARPSIFLLIKFHRLTPEAREKAAEKLEAMLPDKNIVVYSWQSEMTGLYREARQFRDSVLIGGIITLLISLIGLIGYTNDEISRRRSEVAVRKVNGATFPDIIRLFIKEILRLAVPALLIGMGIAYITARKWLEQFSDKVPLSWHLFLGCAVGVLALILGIVFFNVRQTAYENPVDCLKSE